MNGNPSTGVTTGVASRTEARDDLAPRWDVIVWNDPVNLMTYVVFVFQRVFGFNRALATKLMREVHEHGKSLVATEPREQAELHVSQLHSYGLQATLQRHE
jgi:ATP-dependent Clp protease adaptor protein ClpS